MKNFENDFFCNDATEHRKKKKELLEDVAMAGLGIAGDVVLAEPGIIGTIGYGGYKAERRADNWYKSRRSVRTPGKTCAT